MALNSILAAADATAGGRHAVRTAARLAAASGAALTVMTVSRPEDADGAAGALFESGPVPKADPRPVALLRDWLGGDAPEGATLVVALGLPGIEITRLARRRSMGLVVIGRRPRAPNRRLELGQTADALVRRCDVPVLSVPPAVERIDSALIALDGSNRTAHVLDAGMSIACALDIARIRAVTVEPLHPDELAGAAPTERSLSLGRLLDRTAGVGTSAVAIPLAVRRGTVVDEVLAELEARQSELLVIGYRRGGPPKVVGPTDIARHLLYSAPSAVLTIPL